MQEILTSAMDIVDIYLKVDTSKEDELLSKDEILNAFTENREEQYRMFVEGALSHEEQELLIQKDMGEDEKWLPW